MKKLYQYWYIPFVFIIAGCATYYARTIKLQEAILSGQMEKANKILADDKKTPESRNAVLYFLNRGYVSYMLNKHVESNQYFQKADQIIEDQLINYGTEALALITNPMVKPYKPEDFEVVLLNYFTALNYMQLGQLDEALVECKRINIKLNKLNDLYKDRKNRYQRDAFAHLMMGLIYDADGNYNDAFIAYRNALEVYESDYLKNFGVSPPLQLKKDLIRTAYLTGFYEDQHEYEQKFNLKYEKQVSDNPQLVFFWLDGFGPVKDEWSINFTLIPGAGGMLMFVNEEYGLSFPFFIGNMRQNERSAFSDFRMLRVAFPKYIERRPYFTNASIAASSGDYSLELTENVNGIALKTLHDRMLREMANSLLRLATKKAIEAMIAKQNGNLGALVSIANAVSDKADTRNWQTLPYSFSYTRLPLTVGDNSYKLMVSSPNGQKNEHIFNLIAGKGHTYFQSFHSLESLPLGR